jgi:eukaryotic-like serine/threonine-protein kinase
VCRNADGVRTSKVGSTDGADALAGDAGRDDRLTSQYMSPDQIEGKDLDGRSDIVSLSAMLYEMVTGQPAFQGKSQLSVASATLERACPD